MEGSVTVWNIHQSWWRWWRRSILARNIPRLVLKKRPNERRSSLIICICPFLFLISTNDDTTYYTSTSSSEDKRKCVCVSDFLSFLFFSFRLFTSILLISQKHYYRIVRKVERAKKISHLLNMGKCFPAYDGTMMVLKVGIECQILELFDNRSKEHWNNTATAMKA